MAGFPRWKLALSHLIDLPLGRRESAGNGPMQLWLSRGQLKLTTANAVYSYGRHYRSFGRAFDRLGLAADPSVRHVLVLGWAMGSIAELLRGFPHVRSVTGVEHDEVLATWWREWSDEGPFPVELVVEDAGRYAADPINHHRFDLVCADLFVDNKTPPEFIETAFLANLTWLCRPGGRVLLSKLRVTAADQRQNALLEDNLRAAGLHAEAIPAAGNVVYTWLRAEAASGAGDNVPGFR